MRSKSVPDLSSIELLFKPGTDIMPGRQLVQERMATVAGDLAHVGRAAVHDAARIVDQPGHEDRAFLQRPFRRSKCR